MATKKKIQLNVYDIGNGRFAIGATDKRAAYVVAKTKKGFVGIRGQRPVLTSGRFKRTTPTKELRGVFTEALA